MKESDSDLETVWNSVAPGDREFDPQALSNLPHGVREYLEHAIAPGTRLATAVRLEMHGSIKLGRWRKFRAREVIVAERGMIWNARLRMGGLSVRGGDRFLDGQGSMQWKIARFFPLVSASGPDISRSAAARMAAEMIWLPSLLCSEHVWWRMDERDVARARFAIHGHAVELALTLAAGRLRSIEMMRWGNPDGGAYTETSFGAYVDQEATFGGFTIPARLRVGWHFDDPKRFDCGGRFFDVSIDDAVYR
jgi:hypothetical protein